MSVKNLTKKINRIQLNSTPSPKQKQQADYFTPHKRLVQKNTQISSTVNDEHILLNTANKRDSIYKSIPLPSDDEDEDEDESSDDDCLIPKKASVKPSRAHYQKALRKTRSDNSADMSFKKPPMNVTRSAEDIPRIRGISHHSADGDDETIGQIRYRQLKDYQMQNYNHIQSQRKHTQMSGMDLLLQREQEKAGLRRQRSKMIPGQVKIEGLLSRLPEPGTHNISFQQVQLEQKSPKKMPKSAPVYPVMYNPHTMMVPNTHYQLPNIPVSNGSLYMSSQSRPASIRSNRSHHRKSSTHSIPLI